MRFEGWGVTAPCPATVRSSGRLWLPYPKILREFRKAVGSLPGKQLVVAADDGFLQVQRYTLRHRGISRQAPPLEKQPLLPPPTVVLDLLAFERHVGAANVIEAKTARQVERARRESAQRLARAGQLLEPRGISEKMLAKQFESLVSKRSRSKRR